MSPPQVMIVEDEIIVAEDLQRRLSNMGYSVSSIALSGTEAISQAAKNKPDVILMDIKLQDDMDGIEAARQIRKHHAVGIIYATAYSDDDTIGRAKITDPTSYLLKPYSDKELRANIEIAHYKLKLNEGKIPNYQEKLRALAVELSLGEECQRHQFATELHENIAQVLSFFSMKIGILEKSASSQEQAGYLNEIGELATQLIQYIQSLTYEISPPILYEYGLKAVIEWLLEEFESRHGIMCRYERDQETKFLEEDISQLLFFSVRELLDNVAKHAWAGQVNVAYSQTNDNVCITVEDDGVGFDASEIFSRPGEDFGFGLFGIRERLAYFGGIMSIRAKPDEGTCITLQVPFDQVHKQTSDKADNNPIL